MLKRFWIWRSKYKHIRMIIKHLQLKPKSEQENNSQKSNKTSQLFINNNAPSFIILVTIWEKLLV